MISPATIAAVKERAQILDLVREVTEVRKSGSAWLALCVFHKERTPSLHIRPDRSYFKCFGCGEHGDPISFVQKNEGLAFHEAVRSLAERYGIDIEEGTAHDRAEHDAREREAQDLYNINQNAALFYGERLWGREPARGAVYAFEEMEKRGLTGRPEDESMEGAALRAFRIGYAPAAWRSLVEHLQRQKLSLPTAEKAGLLVQKNGRFYDRFRHRLMFPVLDHLGRVVGFSGRILEDPAPEYRDAPDFTVGEKPAKYTNTPETPIYTKGHVLFGLWQGRETVRRQGALLVEGNFDVFSLHARGLAQAIAPLGTAFTEAQARLLRRFSTSVTIAFDGDTAGDKATWTARTAVREARLDARVAVLPEGYDPDKLVLHRGPNVLVELAAHARSLREHLFRRCFAGGGGHEERGRQVQAALKLLAEETDPTLRGMEQVFVDQLASRMSVDGRTPANLRDLELSVRRAMAPRTTAEVLPPPEDPVAFAVLGAVLDVPTVVARSEAGQVLDALEGDLALGVVAAQATSATEVLERMPEMYRRHAEQRLAVPLHTTEDGALGALLANGRRLADRRSIATETELRLQLTDAERAGEEARVDEILAELGRRVRGRVERIA